MSQVILRVIFIIIIIAIVVAVLGSVSIKWEIGFNSSALLLSFLNCVAYILPFKQLFPLFVIVIALTVLKISISLLHTLWDFFPLRG